MALLVNTACSAPPTPFPAEVKGGTHPPAYLVRVYQADDEGNRSAGTGALISGNIVLTASHVVDGKIGSKVEVHFFSDWSVVTGEVMDVSKNDGYGEGAVGHDVAVIKLDEPRKEKPLPVLAKAVKGDVSIEGYAHGPYLRQEGGVYYTHDTSARWGVIRSAQARNGDSGGPITQNGKLAGILWGASEGYTWFTTVEKIIELFPEFVKPTTEEVIPDAIIKPIARPKYSL